MVDSKEYAGMQLVDIIATASTYAVQMYQDDDEYIEKLRHILFMLNYEIFRPIVKLVIVALRLIF